MTIRWDARALQDIRDIRRYIALRGSPAAADRVREHLRARIERLLTRPMIGVITSNPEIRVLPPTRYPYRIYYTIQTDEVVILQSYTSAIARDRSRMIWASKVITVGGFAQPQMMIEIQCVAVV